MLSGFELYPRWVPLRRWNNSEEAKAAGIHSLCDVFAAIAVVDAKAPPFWATPIDLCTFSNILVAFVLKHMFFSLCKKLKQFFMRK